MSPAVASILETPAVEEPVDQNPAIDATAPRKPIAKVAKLHVLPILAAALAARLLVLLIVIRDNPVKWLFDQATELTALAQSLLAGRGLSSPFGGSTGPSAFLTPGYPAIIAVMFRIFGSSTTAAIAIMFLQALFGVATVLGLMLVARRAFGVREANLAGWIWAVSPALLWLPTLYWESSLSTLLLIAITGLSLRCQDQPSMLRWIAIGIIAGFALLINPSLAIALVAIVTWTSWRIFKARSASLSGPVIAALLTILIFAPWPIRNLRVMHAFIPLRSNMGYELWQGNRSGSKGFFSPQLHPNINQPEFNRYASLGEIGYMNEKSALAKAAIHADPARFARLTLKRFLCFWTGFTDRPTSFFVAAHIIFTTIFAAIGLVLLIRRKQPLVMLFLLPLIVFPIPYYLTHPDFRFRLVIDPFATMLTAYALLNLRSSANNTEDPA